MVKVQIQLPLNISRGIEEILREHIAANRAEYQREIDIVNSHTEFWNKKLDANLIRDENHLQILQYQGWRVLTVWECELRDAETLLDKLKTFLAS